MANSEQVRSWAGYCDPNTEGGRAAYGVINAPADFAWMLECWREEDRKTKEAEDAP